MSVRQTFVGRDDDLRQLLSLAEGAAEGRGVLVLLAGEAGIGKTRLAEEVAVRAGSLGLAVRWAACLDDEGRLPTGRGGRCAGTARGRRRSCRGGRGGWSDARIARPALAGAVPRPGDARRADLGLDPGQERFRLFDAVASALRRPAARQPLLVVFDDLHAADLPSLALLRFVARDLRTIR